MQGFLCYDIQWYALLAPFFLSFFRGSGLKVGSKLSTLLPSTCCPGKSRGNIPS